MLCFPLPCSCFYFLQNLSWLEPLMVVVHQGMLSGPWCGEMVWLLAASLVAVDCMSVVLVCQ